MLTIVTEGRVKGGTHPSIHLPLPHEVNPLAFGELGVYRLERLVAQRAPPFAVFAKGLDDLRIHPSFGPDNKEAPRLSHATQVAKIDIAAIGQQQRPRQRCW